MFGPVLKMRYPLIAKLRCRMFLHFVEAGIALLFFFLQYFSKFISCLKDC